LDESYRNLAALLAGRVVSRDPAPRVIGIGGGQGTGKSTLARSLAAALEAAERGRRVAVLSLDDFYLPKAARDRLAAEVHPLLATRGVPGTHDVAALLAAIEALFLDARVVIPVFDKGRDDRVGERVLEGPVARVVVEGWCLGARPQSPADLAEPVNRLERDEDADGTFRRWVNAELAGGYARLAARIDYFVYLAAPDMAAVLRFRAEQERAIEPARRMDEAALARFVAHYERITRALLRDAPGRADALVRLGPDRSYSVQAPGATVSPESKRD
jgi:D-glycerate 3-kinase